MNKSLVVVDEFSLLINYEKLLNGSFKILIPNAVIGSIRKKAMMGYRWDGYNPSIDDDMEHPIEHRYDLKTEYGRKKYLRLCQIHCVQGLLRDFPDRYEVIGSTGTGWVQKIQPFADFFQKEKELSYFEDQTRVAATLLALHEKFSSVKIFFLSEDKSLKEFVKLAFKEFVPELEEEGEGEKKELKLLKFQGAHGKLPEELYENTGKSVKKVNKKKFSKEEK